MIRSTTGPMLGAVRTGDAPGESSWDRQGFQEGLYRRTRSDRRYKDVARRGLRRLERARLRAELAAEMAELAAEPLPTYVAPEPDVPPARGPRLIPPDRRWEAPADRDERRLAGLAALMRSGTSAVH